MNAGPSAPAQAPPPSAAVGASLPADDQALLARYLSHVRVEKRLSARTVELYTLHLGQLAALCAGEALSLCQVQEAHVRRWIAQSRAAGRSPRGAALILSVWRGFYTWLGREGLVSRHPVTGVRAPKAAKPLPKALALEDALRLAEHRQPDAASEMHEARDRCIVELLYGSGLRLSELLGLDAQPSGSARGWIDAEAGEAHVLGKGHKRRSVPVGAPALAALQAWLALRPRWARDDPALFIGQGGARLSPQHTRLRLRQRAANAGLDAPVHPHMLRHSFASHVLQSSQDLRAVQELLGHANITTTQVYTRLDFQHLARAYEAAHPRARRRGGGEPGSIP